ncbi:MAG: FKBP-type peptidyl-prolyl cis-trans isomerase [Burkholderiales bacterium]|nr:FKBP-type peptidyl-prolyl cis-trans isomerase [Burkholderiales bacterium]MDE1928697.1 FKBP-type peptidyl-prolyl cis-trans isomerase [Burkholderiales bacterium]MDE2159013.1 FKBP-type peptidyl-prolyl cis-trans isomerase [Burkholderiales bacterium]MDE2504016.1 FKBP-type peptidyl-prolyl cis-trans isomerase [Burkholderiales bacterium]
MTLHPLRLLAGIAITAVACRAGAQTRDPLVDAAAAPGAVKTASGAIVRILRQGQGASPKADDEVRVNYRGAFTDGRVFDSSYVRGAPATFHLDRVIRCWTEGLQLMKVGGRALLTCPSWTAYGETGNKSGTIPGETTLVFDVELLGIVK